MISTVEGKDCKVNSSKTSLEHRKIFQTYFTKYTVKICLAISDYKIACLNNTILNVVSSFMLYNADKKINISSTNTYFCSNILSFFITTANMGINRLSEIFSCLNISKSSEVMILNKGSIAKEMMAVSLFAT